MPLLPNLIFKSEEHLFMWNEMLKIKSREHVRNLIVQEIPVNSVVVGSYNPRIIFDPKHIEDLAASISKDGQWDPIIVKPIDNGKYCLISGECRLRAVKKLGWDKIKAIILNIGEEEAHLLAIKTNLMRRDLNPIEEAIGIKRLIKMGWNKERIAKQLNKSQTWVNIRLKLIEKAGKNLQSAIIKGLIPLTYGVELADLPKPLQGIALEKVLKESLNLNEVRMLVKLLKEAKTKRDMTLILKTPKNKLIKRFASFHPSCRRSEKKVYVTVSCKCGMKYLIDTTNHRVVSVENRGELDIS